MTAHEREQIERCRRVIADAMAKEKRAWEVGRLKIILRDLDLRLTEPVQKIDYKGEHFKTDNPFEI